MLKFPLTGIWSFPKLRKDHYRPNFSGLRKSNFETDALGNWQVAISSKLDRVPPLAGQHFLKWVESWDFSELTAQSSLDFLRTFFWIFFGFGSTPKRGSPDCTYSTTFTAVSSKSRHCCDLSWSRGDEHKGHHVTELFVQFQKGIYFDRQWNEVNPNQKIVWVLSACLDSRALVEFFLPFQVVQADPEWLLKTSLPAPKSDEA